MNAPVPKIEAGPDARVPARLRKEVERILITEDLVKNIYELKDRGLRASIRQGRDEKHYIHVLKALEEVEHVTTTYRQTAAIRL